MNVIRSFDPVITQESKILILGTMPGIASLTKAEYYGHPRNAFWPIMAQITNRLPAPETYIEKIDLLKNNKIALWDVCRQCLRTGSLDSNICREEPNMIPELLAKYPSIGLLVFNGQPAFRLFKKHFRLKELDVEYLIMPSTSPANASYSFTEKLERWSEIKKWLK